MSDQSEDDQQNKMQVKEHKFTTLKITILLFVICLVYWVVVY